MGFGLVDPILPAISAELGASPSQALLLSTSYLARTGLAMFFTSFVSSRLGAKLTLVIGLALIVVFAALAPLGYSRRPGLPHRDPVVGTLFRRRSLSREIH